MYHGCSHWTNSHEIWKVGPSIKICPKNSNFCQNRTKKNRTVFASNLGTFHCCQRHKFSAKSLFVQQSAFCIFDSVVYISSVRRRCLCLSTTTMVTPTRHLMANLVVSILFLSNLRRLLELLPKQLHFFIRTSLQNDKSSDSFHNHHKMY